MRQAIGHGPSRKSGVAMSKVVGMIALSLLFTAPAAGAMPQDVDCVSPQGIEDIRGDLNRDLRGASQPYTITRLTDPAVDLPGSACRFTAIYSDGTTTRIVVRFTTNAAGATEYEFEEDDENEDEDREPD